MLSKLENFYFNIKIINEAIREGKLVIFVGAGTSLDAGVPAWGELIRTMSKDLEIGEEAIDPLVLAQMYYNDKKDLKYFTRVAEILKYKRARFNRIHRAIFALNPEHIITTNYDDLLEQVIKEDSLPYSVVRRDVDFPLAQKTKLLVKMHGDFESGSFVLKEDDYINYSNTHPLIEGFVKSVFASRVVVFLGYSFSDNNLKSIVENVRKILGSNFQQSYFVSLDDEVSQLQRDYLLNKGIVVINYNDALVFPKSDSEKLCNQIEEKIENDVQGPRVNRSLIGLSDKGVRLVKLLYFIKNYNPFLRDCNGLPEPIVMIRSIKRYSGLRVLPPKIIARLLPFNGKYSSDSSAIETDNIELVKFLSSIYIKPNFSVEIRDNSLVGFNKSQVERDLASVLKTLNLSYVFSLKAKEFPNGEFLNADLMYSWQECTCLVCHDQLQRMEALLTKLSYVSVTPTSDVHLDMEVAYELVQLGRLKEAFSFYKEIANKAWSLNMHFSYYISKLNLLEIIEILSRLSNTVSDNEMDDRLELLETIDRNKLLNQIPIQDEIEHQLYLHIRDNSILIESSITFARIHREMSELLRSKKEELDFGIAYSLLWEAEISFRGLISFYEGNHILIQNNAAFRQCCQLMLDFYFMTERIRKMCNHDVKVFTKEFVSICFSRVKYDEFKDAQARIGIQQIELDNDGQFVFVRLVLRLLDSFTGENEENEICVKSLSQTEFKRNVRDRLKLVMELCSRVQLSNTDVEDIFSPLLITYRNEFKDNFDVFSCFSFFIKSKPSCFSKRQLSDYLGVFVDKPGLWETAINDVFIISKRDKLTDFEEFFEFNIQKLENSNSIHELKCAIALVGDKNRAKLEKRMVALLKMDRVVQQIVFLEESNGMYLRDFEDNLVDFLLSPDRLAQTSNKWSQRTLKLLISSNLRAKNKRLMRKRLKGYWQILAYPTEVSCDLVTREMVQRELSQFECEQLLKVEGLKERMKNWLMSEFDLKIGANFMKLYQQA